MVLLDKTDCSVRQSSALFGSSLCLFGWPRCRFGSFRACFGQCCLPSAVPFPSPWTPYPTCCSAARRPSGARRSALAELKILSTARCHVGAWRRPWSQDENSDFVCVLSAVPVFYDENLILDVYLLWVQYLVNEKVTFQWILKSQL